MIPVAGDDQGVEVVLSFLSPITPTSTFRQAIPASYLAIYVQGSTDIDIYIDINGQWVSGDRGSRIDWDHQTKSSTSEPSDDQIKFHRFQRETRAHLTEINDRSEWGHFYFVAPAVSFLVIE